MEYQVKKFDYQGNPLDLCPIGIWQNSYFFLKNAYTISLFNKTITVQAQTGEIRKHPFKNSLGVEIKQILSDLGFKKTTNLKMMGFLAYDYAKNLEKIRGFNSHESHPEFFLLIPETFIVKNKNQFELYDLFGNYKEITPRSKNISTQRIINRGWDCNKEIFCSLTEQAQKYISEGDIFQLVLSNKLILENNFDPYQLYQSLHSRNPSAYHFLLQFDKNYLVGASPETMLKFQQKNRKMLMRLIAGTYPKVESKYSKDPTLMLSDEKELAEHMMLVDHCRNDLGRVAEIGSVKVTDLLKVETLNDVYHLVSQVEAILKNDLNCFDALDSCFPISTLTGTPKIRAMEIISELENRPRGLFGGAVGLFDSDLSVDLAVIIRSAIMSKDKIEIYAGAGIVKDSIPEREFEECLWKAEALKDIISQV